MPTESYVLIIDPSEDCCFLLEKVFAHKCKLAAVGLSSGRQALELVAEREPLLIVFDLRLPDISAKELITRLRQTPAGRERILIGTSTQGEEAARNFLRSGELNAFLSKPLDLEVFVKTVRRLLRHHH